MMIVLAFVALIMCSQCIVSSYGSCNQFGTFLQDISLAYDRTGSGPPTCLSKHSEACGWTPVTQSRQSGQIPLPLYVLAVGLEGSGHHLWSELLGTPVFDCLWFNGRHYHRDVGDGLARTSVAKLEQGFREQFALRRQSQKLDCRYLNRRHCHFHHRHHYFVQAHL